ncbi:hypothetical protein [Marinomonas pollencensis]|uniref:Uncharacterized protein n=1 Tax=Marinomonas pollencensis TaxID=491954 RepID=A0A3E0DUH5_9GAMM|nr:hypothetical protein [Marinomonas pollencensis]REG86558.1 hypothetical protein DFP81_101123 [Marinomonas pollencensis]
MNWLIENKEWIFSGVGVSVIIFILSVLRKNSDSKQVQKSGANSTNYQAGGDIKIGEKK